MPKNLRWKWLFIFATVVVCILSVTDVPTSTQQLLENLNNNIRLGLDLKGGSHLVLQVQVQDALKSEADQLMEQLQPQLQKEGITYASIDRNDPNSIEAAESIAVEVHGVPAAREADFSRIVSAVGGDRWMLQREGTDVYRLQMRRSAALALRQDTLEKTIETLDRKVNALGVAEASVQHQAAKRGKSNFSDLVNESINQTLSRTLLTAGLTLLACLALYFLGGEVLNGIAFALIAGILVGTYSSIFVASALLAFWHERSLLRRQQSAGSTAGTAPAVALWKQ